MVKHNKRKGDRDLHWFETEGSCGAFVAWIVFCIFAAVAFYIRYKVTHP